MHVKFGYLVKTVRKQLQMSQEQLARELSVSVSTINRWERAKSRPSQMAKELFRQFCLYNNIDLGELERAQMQ